MTDSIFRKFTRLVRQRPLALYEMLRGKSLFLLTHSLGKMIPHPGVSTAQGMRLQRFSSLQAERPDARIFVGENTIIYESNAVKAYGKGVITIGENSILGGAKIYAQDRIELGKRCLVSWNVFIQDYDPHPLDAESRAEEVLDMVANFTPRLGCTLTSPDQIQPKKISSSPIVIGDDVWIGAGVTILKGAKIGDNCIIATGAVVTKGSYPNSSVIAGNPAKVVKTLSMDNNEKS